MHVSGLSLDLYSLLQFIFTALFITFGSLHLVKSIASKYFVVDTNFDEGGSTAIERRGRSPGQMIAVAGDGDGCTVCGGSAKKKCSGCKAVRYCSETCQSKHWKADHKFKCKEFKFLRTTNSTSISSCGGEASLHGGKSSTDNQRLKKVLFPYEEFVKLFNRDKPGFPPCGLLNCGNSCFANVVLQCLSCTRPLIVYLFEKGHRRECRRNDWCFFCELQIHVERARQSLQPFSPINILSRLPNIGGNLGYGKQEDAHEFMRFAIDTMQSVCLDEYGGEKALHPSSQETSLIQYIFGGHLQSQVTCTKCNKISYRYENMMDLTVEIQGDAASLEDCLDLFTAKEWLDGENMYKCDGCNDYVKACKRLTIHQAPNILTIALKRFQSGRFGKLNKRVTFPETLDLGPYMSDPGDGTDLYQLYAVVVHVDMLNASFFGHYICYTKDFSGNWYRIDDCKVTTIELEEVLSQGAYMLLYSRTCVRPCVKPLETPREEEQQLMEVDEEAQQCSREPDESISYAVPISYLITQRSVSSDISSHTQESSPKREDPVVMDLDDPIMVDSKFTGEDLLDSGLDNPIKVNLSSQDLLVDLGDPINFNLWSAREDSQDLEMSNFDLSASDSKDLDNHVSKHSQTTNIASSSEIVHGQIPNSVPLGVAFPSVEVPDLECEISRPISDLECTLVDGNEVGRKCNKNYTSLDCSMDGCFTSGSDLQETAKTSSSLPVASLSSAQEMLHEVNPSCLIPGLKQVTSESCEGFPAVQNTETKTSKSAGAHSFSQAKLKPLFSPGFLDKRTRFRSMNRNEKVRAGLGEAGKSSKVGNHDNGFSEAGFPHQNNSKVNGRNGSSDFDGPSTATFIKEQSEKFLNGDGMIDGQFGGGDCSTKNSCAVEISSSMNLVLRGGPDFAPMNESSSSIEAQNLEPELSGTKFDVPSVFGNGNGARSSCNTELSLSESRMDSQHDDHEMIDMSSSVPIVDLISITETLDESNIDSFQSLLNPRLEQVLTVKSGKGSPAAQVTEAKPLKVAEGNSGSRGDSNPLSYSPDFLDKHLREGPLNRNEKAIEPDEVRKMNGSCNGFAKSGSHHQNCSKVKGHDEILNCDSLLASPSFIGKRSTTCLNENGMVKEVLDKVANPWHSCDRSGEAESESIIPEANKICNNSLVQETFVGNGKSVFSPGFLDKSLRKKSLNSDAQGQEVSKNVTSLHDRTKLPRIG